MTRIHATSLIALAAAAIVLSGCDTLNEGDDTVLYALDATSPQELADAVRAAKPDAAGPLTQIGTIDGRTGDYRFGSGLVIDPGDILEIDEEDLAASKRCGESTECSEDGSGVVPSGGWPEGSCWIFEETDQDIETVCAGCCTEGVCFELCSDVT